MATYYFRNTGDSNWGTATNWSFTSGGPGNGSVPTSNDDAILDSNSGNCTTNTTDRSCKNLNTTGYVNTLNLNRNLNVYGNIIPQMKNSSVIH